MVEKHVFMYVYICPRKGFSHSCFMWTYCFNYCPCHMLCNVSSFSLLQTSSEIGEVILFSVNNGKQQHNITLVIYVVQSQFGTPILTTLQKTVSFDP